MVLSDILTSDEEHVMDKMIRNEETKNLYKAVNNLKPREKEIIVLRYGLFDSEALTQKEVADLLGISQSYISRLEKRIIDKMRQEILGKVKVS